MTRMQVCICSVVLTRMLVRIRVISPHTRRCLRRSMCARAGVPVHAGVRTRVNARARTHHLCVCARVPVYVGVPVQIYGANLSACPRKFMVSLVRRNIWILSSSDSHGSFGVE
jgi:hypothetical protein